MAKSIMIQGTMSNVGKSALAAGLCRVLKQDGYKVATFQIPKYGTQFFYHKRRTGDGKSPGDAGRSCRD